MNTIKIMCRLLLLRFIESWQSPVFSSMMATKPNCKEFKTSNGENNFFIYNMTLLNSDFHMSNTISFQLPASYLDGADCAQNKKLISAAKEQLDILERQELYFQIKDLLETKMDGVVVRSFKYSTGSHYNDDGYSDHIALEATFVDIDGQVATMQADDDYGGYDDERFEVLHDMIDAWPSSISTKLENKLIKCENEADLGKSIMGAKGYALYEANLIEHAADKGAISSTGALRV